MTTGSCHCNCTLKSLVEQAVDRLPVLRRRIVKRYINSSRHAEAFYDELISQLQDDEGIKTLGLEALFAYSGFNELTEFSIDLDKLERLLQIIIEYLPQILEIIMKLFA